MSISELTLAIPTEAMAPIAILIVIVFALVASVLLAVIYGALARIEQLLVTLNRMIEHPTDSVLPRKLRQRRP